MFDHNRKKICEPSRANWVTSGKTSAPRFRTDPKEEREYKKGGFSAGPGPQSVSTVGKEKEMADDREPWSERADEAAVPTSILYRLVGRATKAAIDDFSPAMFDLCDAVDAAQGEYKETIDGLVGELNRGARLPRARFDPIGFASLAALHNESLMRFVMSMRGTLKMMVETDIREVHLEKPALERVSRISDLKSASAPLEARMESLTKSRRESKRRSADAARLLGKAAEARFFRRVICVLHGARVEGEGQAGDSEEWEEALEWARKRAGARGCVMDRMQRVLSELIRHKRAIDWELDSRWTYDPAAPCRHFVGGTPGTPSA